MSGNSFQQYPGAPAPSANPFADQMNPYAAPQTMVYQQAVAVGAPTKHPGLWRQGNVLVMHKSAPLPEICVKSNQPAARRILRKLQWHHPLIALTILAGLLVYLILALVLTKRASIYIYLTEEWYHRRQRRMIFACLAGLAALGLCVAGVALAINYNDGTYVGVLVLGVVIGIVALIYGQYATGMVRPIRITDEYVWLKGVHPDFLNRLEVWQWNI